MPWSWLKRIDQVGFYTPVSFTNLVFYLNVLSPIIDGVSNDAFETRILEARLFGMGRFRQFIYFGTSVVAVAAQARR